MNRLILIGNLGADPVLRYHPSTPQTPVCTIRIASHEVIHTESGLDRHTEWHDCVLTDDLARRFERQTKRGVKVYLEGFIRTQEVGEGKKAERRVHATYFEVVHSPRVASGGDGQGETNEQGQSD